MSSCDRLEIVLFALVMFLMLFVCLFQLLKDFSAVVIDHTNYAVSETEGDHTLIASDDFIQSDVILGSTKIEVSCIIN